MDCNWLINRKKESRSRVGFQVVIIRRRVVLPVEAYFIDK